MESSADKQKKKGHRPSITPETGLKGRRSSVTPEPGRGRRPSLAPQGMGAITRSSTRQRMSVSTEARRISTIQQEVTSPQFEKESSIQEAPEILHEEKPREDERKARALARWNTIRIKLVLFIDVETWFVQDHTPSKARWDSFGGGNALEFGE